MQKNTFIGSVSVMFRFYNGNRDSFSKSRNKVYHAKGGGLADCQSTPAPEHDDLNWPQGALYVGMVDWAELAEKEDNDDTYYKWLTRIGRRNCWQPDKRFYHADDIAVSQSFFGFIPQVQRRSNDYPYARPYGMDCQSSIRR